MRLYSTRGIVAETICSRRKILPKHSDEFQKSQELLEIIFKNVCAWALGYYSGLKEMHSDSLETLGTKKKLKKDRGLLLSIESVNTICLIQTSIK